MKTMKNKFKTLSATTNGRGYWSDEKRTTKIRDIVLDYMDFDDFPTYIVLNVFFYKKDWNIEDHGLIYTDEKWIAELRKGLRSLGLETTGLAYTEQGMQGDDFVSLCVTNKKTIDSLTLALGQKTERNTKKFTKAKKTT